MRILVTGGAGYIGSHTVVQLLEAGHDVQVYDNLSNSTPVALTRIEEITGRTFDFVEGDMRDGAALSGAMERFKPEAVVHFAGLKAVGDSVRDPVAYYSQNVSGTLNLLDQMTRQDCARIVFSSSATVYGTPDYLPYDEAHPVRPESPYGRTKLFIEKIIRDWCAAHEEARAALLRYFNPVGAHPSGRIGEDPKGVPNNLLPFIAQVAVGRREALSVFGNDYDTRDGTGERDYIHVDDLAAAHIAALGYLEQQRGCDVFNVGTGHGATVLEMVAHFERAAGVSIPYRIEPRRPGDVAAMAASVDKSAQTLGWRATRSLEEACASAWHWQTNNPKGYDA